MATSRANNLKAFFVIDIKRDEKLLAHAMADGHSILTEHYAVIRGSLILSVP